MVPTITHGFNFVSTMRILYLLLILLSATACLSPIRDIYPEEIEERSVPVYIVSHGWHAGIAVESLFIREYLPEDARIPETRILKFGWGDERYYTDPNAGFWLMLRAALLPTRSVIHVVGTDLPIERYFRNSRVIQIQITKEGAGELGRFIAGQLKPDRNQELIYVAEGLYANSLFFQAEGRYFLPKTSNIWTARALRSTGFPITPFYALTSGNVLHQAGKEGVEIFPN